MKPTQIYSLLNDINGQMFGSDAIAVNDLSGIISMGRSIVGNANNTDAFLGKLVDRIGKTVIRTLDLELDFPALYMDTFEFGAVLQKINVNPFDAIENVAEEVGDVGFTPSLLDVHKPDIFVRYFSDSTTAKWQVTIPDTMFMSAFDSEERMSQFIDAIIKAMTDSVTISINNMSRTAINNFIAEKFKASNNCINLLTGYNAIAATPITAAKCMYDREFLRYAVNEIRKYIKYLSQPSVLYNMGDGSGGTVVRTTARDNMHVLCLTNFVAAVEAYLQNGDQVMHNEFLTLPGYTEVAYWQGNKGATATNDFDTNSTIKVTPSSEAGAQSPTDVEKSGIIAVLADRQAIAVGISRRHTGTFYNSIDQYSNMSMSFVEQWINDTSENGVIFYVEDSNSVNPNTRTTKASTK